MTHSVRLVLWLAFVGILIATSYALRAEVGKPERDALYRYETAVGGLLNYAVVLAVVVAIAGASATLLALRRPDSWRRALWLALGAFVFIYVVAGILDRFLRAGEEQGLTPTEWEPSRAGQYAANFVVVAVGAPIVEELAYRGLGYSLLARFGDWVAIVVTALLFGLSHGLVEGLPVLTAFGLALGWLRMRTGSVYPGMVVHAVFNALALVVAVTI